MEVMPGKRTGTTVYFYKGYLYHRDGRNSGTIFRCARRDPYSCDARLYVQHIRDIGREEAIEEVGDHFCPKADLDVLKKQFIEELKQSAQTKTNLGLKEIYDHTKIQPKYEPLYDKTNMRYDLVKLTMSKARRESVPSTPLTLTQLGDTLLEYHPLKNFYKGQAEGKDQSIAQIFINDSFLKPLASVSQLFCDGTFNIRCRIPPCAQVFIIHFRKGEQGFPAIICLTSHMTTDMYNAIWEKIFNIIPDLKWKVKSIHMDFEKAQIKSVKESFLNARITGCLFHYKQAIVKRWGKLKLSPEYNYILEITYALAHLPEKFMAEGVQCLTNIVDELPEDISQRDKLQNFSAYIRKYWLPLASIFSIYGQRVRTNNTCENFHMQAAKKLGRRPPVWKLLSELQDISNSYAVDYKRVAKGDKMHLRLPLDTLVADRLIREAEEDLEIGRYNVPDFLTYIASLRRIDLAAMNMYKAKQIRLRRRTLQQTLDDDDKDEEAEDDDEENPIDIEFLKQNLKTLSTAGREFENQIVLKMKGRTQIINDDELMPEATQQTLTESKSRSKKKTPQMQAPEDQQDTVTDIQSDQANENRSNSLPEAGKRRRGRPRKNTSAQAPELQRDSYQTQTDRVKDNQSNFPSAAATRRRGRPRKRKEAPASIENLSEEFHEEANGDVELAETDGCSPNTAPIRINTADVNRAISPTADHIRLSANGSRAMFPINSTLHHAVATMKNIFSSDDESVQGDGEIEKDTEMDVASAAQSTTVDGEDHVNTNVIDAMPDALQILKRPSNSDRYVPLGDESVMEYDKDNAFMTDNDDQNMGNIDMFPSAHQILQKYSNPDRDVVSTTLSTEVCGKDSEFITENDFDNMSDIDMFPNNQQILQTTSNHDTHAASADKSATAYEKDATFVSDNDDESISDIEMFPDAQQILQKSNKSGIYVTSTNFPTKVHEKDSAVITEDDYENMGDIDLLWDVHQILPETSNSDRYAASADVLSTISNKNYNFHLEPKNISSTSDNTTIGLDNVVQLLENRPIIANCSESTIRTTNTDSSTSLVTCSSKEKKKRRRLPKKRCEIQTCRARFRVRRLDCRHRFCVPCIRSLKKRICPKCSTPIGNYLPLNQMGGENWENEMETEEPNLFNAIRQGIDNCNFITL